MSCYKFYDWKIGHKQYYRYTGIEFSRYLFYIHKSGMDYEEGVYGKELSLNLALDKSKAHFLSDLANSPLADVAGFKGAICKENTTTYFFETPVFNSRRLFQSVLQLLREADSQSKAA